MTDVDLDKCMTLIEAADHLGISRRGMYRVAERAEADGHVVRIRRFGRFLFLKSAFPTMRKYHLPHDKKTPLATEFRQKCGQKGGRAKAENACSRELGQPVVPAKVVRLEARQSRKIAKMLEGMTVEQLAIAKDLIDTTGSPEDAQKTLRAITKLIATSES